MKRIRQEAVASYFQTVVNQTSLYSWKVWVTLHDSFSLCQHISLFCKERTFKLSAYEKKIVNGKACLYINYQLDALIIIYS